MSGANWQLVKAFEAMHPTLSVIRDALGSLAIGVRKNPTSRFPHRKIGLQLYWVSNDRAPDIQIGVFEASGQNDAMRLDRAKAQFVIPTSQGQYRIQHEEGAKLAKRPILETARKGVDFFLAYLALPQSARILVRASSVLDGVRSRTDLAVIFRTTDVEKLNFVQGGSTATPTETLAIFKAALDKATV